MRIALYTLGCKVNQFESQALGDQFAALGHELVSWRDDADMYLVNTCTVTARAAAQSRQMVRRFRREHSDARVVATGCHVQTGAAEIMQAAEGRVCLAGNDQKHRIVDIALAGGECLEMYVGDIFSVRKIAPFMIHSPVERTRAFVRVQDGCDAFCSYCIVPFARGRSRSMPPEHVYEQVDILAGEGIREIVITGIHVGRYGLDLAETTTLTALLKSLCMGFPEIRFRLSSIDPSEITDEMVEWAGCTENFCHHWHLPLQSGTDIVLQAMNRRYTSAEFRAVVEKLWNLMPDAAFGIDVMTGFPGEGHEEFLETLRFLEALPATYLHVFPYSPRPHTIAAALSGHVPKRRKSERARILRQLGARKKREFYRRNLGTVHGLLLERRDRKTGMWYGVTDNYISALYAGTGVEKELQNCVIQVRLTELRERVVLAESV